MGFLSRYQTNHPNWATATNADSYLRVVNTYRLLELLDASTSAATTTEQGLMSSADKVKLNGIATNANNYSHPTGNGNNHIPSGGSSGQILRWSSSGTATWGADNDTVYTHPTGNGNNHISSGGSSGQFLKWSSSGTATWAADNNTTYSNATTSAAGLMSASDKNSLNNLAKDHQKVFQAINTIFYDSDGVDHPQYDMIGNNPSICLCFNNVNTGNGPIRFKNVSSVNNRYTICGRASGVSISMLWVNVPILSGSFYEITHDYRGQYIVLVTSYNM
jgi:hypothetical protein